MNKIFSLFLTLVSIHLHSAYAFECKDYRANSEDRIAAFKAIEDKAYKLGLDYHGYMPNLESPIGTSDSLEAFLIQNYTNGYYKTINPALRSDQVSIEQNLLLKIICSALTNLERYDGIVYRVTKLPKNIKRLYKKGEIITEKAFTSTSMDEEGVKAYLRNSGAGSNTFFYIISKNGKNLSNYSSNMQEREILFAAGTKFLVTKTSFTVSGMKKVYMTEI